MLPVERVTSPEACTILSHLNGYCLFMALFLPLVVIISQLHCKYCSLCCCQATTSNMESRRSDASWLRHTLNTLYPADSPNYDTENLLLMSLITRYEHLLPVIEATTVQSMVVVRCYDYKVSVERQVQWLMEMEERLREGVSLDDCHSVRAMLDELEVSCCYCIILAVLCPYDSTDNTHQYDIYGAVVMAQIHCESSLGSFDFLLWICLP